MMQKLSTAILVIAIAAGAGGLAEAAKDQWVIALGDEPHSLSPASKGPLPLASDYLQSHIYDALVDFAGPNLTLRPMLAERWENPTPTVWRFSLRRGVRFHNGDPLTAEDIKFTIDYQLANKGSTMNAYLGPTDNAKVIDPYTVEITTSAPFPALLFNLARVHIMPRALDKMGADAFAAKPIGSGAYKFVEWQRGQRIVLEANPDYWAGVPTPKRLLFRPIADPSTRAAELRAGGVDIITNPPLARSGSSTPAPRPYSRLKGGVSSRTRSTPRKNRLTTSESGEPSTMPSTDGSPRSSSWQCHAACRGHDVAPNREPVWIWPDHRRQSYGARHGRRGGGTDTLQAFGR
jgi:ABC-type transport system substrate-binding protein